MVEDSGGGEGRDQREGDYQEGAIPRTDMGPQEQSCQGGVGVRDESMKAGRRGLPERHHPQDRQVKKQCGVGSMTEVECEKRVGGTGAYQEGAIPRTEMG